jgi:hypothetical protein
LSGFIFLVLSLAQVLLSGIGLDFEIETRQPASPGVDRRT